MKTQYIAPLISTLFLLALLEIAGRVGWTISTELRYGYYHRYKWNHDYQFTPNQLLPRQERISAEEQLQDLIQAFRQPLGEKKSLIEKFSNLDFSSNQTIISSLNALIQETKLRKEFLSFYQDAANWQNPEIVELLKKERRSTFESQRAARLMLESMFSLYEKFPYGYYYAHQPLDRLFYGKQSSISLFHDTIQSRDLLKPVDSEALQMVVLGGSTAKCTGVNPSQCWTAYLEEKLNQHRASHPNFPKFQIKNLGISSGSSTDSREALLNAYHSTQSPLRPDYLLWYEGLNDVYYFTERPEMKPQTNQGTFSIPKSQNASKNSFLSRSLFYLHQHSALIYLLFRVKEKIISNSNKNNLENKELENEDKQVAWKESVQLAAKLNIENLEKLRPLVRKGIFMFSIPLPKEVTKRRFHLDYDAKVKMFDHLKNYAQSNKIPFGDIASLLEAKQVEEVFTSDRVHLNAYGNYLLAEEIFQFILPFLEKDQERERSEITGA